MGLIGNIQLYALHWPHKPNFNKQRFILNFEWCSQIQSGQLRKFFRSSKSQSECQHLLNPTENSHQFSERSRIITGFTGDHCRPLMTHKIGCKLAGTLGIKAVVRSSLELLLARGQENEFKWKFLNRTQWRGMDVGLQIRQRRQNWKKADRLILRLLTNEWPYLSGIWSRVNRPLPPNASPSDLVNVQYTNKWVYVWIITWATS